MISGVIGGVYTDQPDSVIIVTHLGFYKASVSTLGEGINLFPSADWQGSIKSVAGVIGNDIFLEVGEELYGTSMVKRFTHIRNCL